jgi:nicotinic acid mononucleotide adenylyltransferase
MAREAQALFPAARIELVLGRDAAERIAAWEYETPRVFEDLLREFRLRVAPRAGVFEHGERLDVPAECEAISATEVRRRIRAGEPWQDLVPPQIEQLVRDTY